MQTPIGPGRKAFPQRMDDLPTHLRQKVRGREEGGGAGAGGGGAQSGAAEWRGAAAGGGGADAGLRGPRQPAWEPAVQPARAG